MESSEAVIIGNKASPYLESNNSNLYAISFPVGTINVFKIINKDFHFVYWLDTLSMKRSADILEEIESVIKILEKSKEKICHKDLIGNTMNVSIYNSILVTLYELKAVLGIYPDSWFKVVSLRKVD